MGAEIELQRTKQKMGTGIELEYLGRRKFDSIMDPATRL
jgi:hypothetical protein